MKYTINQKYIEGQLSQSYEVFDEIHRSCKNIFSFTCLLGCK